MKKFISYLVILTISTLLLSGCCYNGCGSYYYGAPYYNSSYPVSYQYVPVSPVVNYVPTKP